MELDSRKKSRRDKMMRSKNFATQDVNDRLEESWKVESLSQLINGKIEDV